MSNSINWTSEWSKGFTGHTSRSFVAGGIEHQVSLDKGDGGWGVRITAVKGEKSETVDRLSAWGNNKREAKDWATWRAQRITEGSKS